MALPQNTEVLHYQLRIGQIPLSPPIPLEVNEQLPRYARGYIGLPQQELQIMRSPDDPQRIRVWNVRGRLLRRGVSGLSLENMALSTRTNIPGLRRYYLTREPTELTQMQNVLRRIISRTIMSSHESLLPSRRPAPTKRAEN